MVNVSRGYKYGSSYISCGKKDFLLSNKPEHPNKLHINAIYAIARQNLMMNINTLL